MNGIDARRSFGLAAGVCAAGMVLALGLTAVAAQGGDASPDLAAPEAEAPPANSPPTVGVRGGAVRAGETLVLAAYATDMESEAVHLEASLDLKPGQRAPAWLGGTVWTADLAAQPILRIPLSPPADAEPGAYSLLVAATDSGGLTSWRRMTLEVLPPAEPEPSAGASPGASGGAGSYTFRWQGTSTDGNPVTYVFGSAGTYTRSVTVTDANGNRKTSDPPAEIVCSPPGGAGGSSDEEGTYIRVPLGGALIIVWGNGGVTAVSSKDPSVATASASGDEITVTGVSVGETDIVVQADGVEYWVPVRVEGS